LTLVRKSGGRSFPISSRSLETVHITPVAGSKSMPLGLRIPEAKIRALPEAMSYSQIAARPVSFCRPLSPTFELEPTVA
jgi:hypothetical protein